MSLSLAEALGQVDLVAGRIYRCHVKDKWVEIRVLGHAEIPPVSSYDDSDEMLDPWVEFPRPTAGIRLRAQPGTLPLPDVPQVLADDDLT